MESTYETAINTSANNASWEDPRNRRLMTALLRSEFDCVSRVRPREFQRVHDAMVDDATDVFDKNNDIAWKVELDAPGETAYVVLTQDGILTLKIDDLTERNFGTFFARRFDSIAMAVADIHRYWMGVGD